MYSVSIYDLHNVQNSLEPGLNNYCCINDVTVILFNLAAAVVELEVQLVRSSCIIPGCHGNPQNVRLKNRFTCFTTFYKRLSDVH